MNTRATLWLLLVALALGGFIWFHEMRIAPEREELEARETRIFPDLGAEQISELEILTSDGKRARLLRTGDASASTAAQGAGSDAAGLADSEDAQAGAEPADGTAKPAAAEANREAEASGKAEGGAGGYALLGASDWMLTEPLLYPADSLTVDGVLDALAGLSYEKAYDAPAALEQYGLADPPAIHFESLQGSHLLKIGEEAPVGGGIYVTDGKAERVFVIPAYSVNALRKSLNALRDARVLDFDADSITGLNIAWPGVRLELLREPGAAWRFGDPALGLASQERVNDLLLDLQYLRADDFIDEPASDRKLGLHRPKFSAELTALGRTMPLRFEVGITQTVTERVAQDEESDSDAEAGEAGEEVEEFEEKEVLVVRGRNGQVFFIPAGRMDDFPRDTSDYQAAVPAAAEGEAEMEAEMGAAPTP